ncbi:hypothetical protein HPB50_005290 [Hyalomma asiaticum]|uniref:Uncharacterized protein n=1 Tax=Hyalomma asiaticum TaxID=266040 RepID=A0ACB7TEX8_HYAAI|nr:hypothetical protein HPB50_005290 [Hyalomma asiaticum]
MDIAGVDWTDSHEPRRPTDQLTSMEKLGAKRNMRPAQDTKLVEEAKFRFMTEVAGQFETSGVKLPKLTINPFANDSGKWSEFWEQFNQIFSQSGNFTVAGKLK